VRDGAVERGLGEREGADSVPDPLDTEDGHHPT
jgi:hypothetical protein